MTISANLLHDYTVAVFRGAGLDAEDAHDVADHLVDANLLGMDSHGIIRVGEYLQCLDDKHVIANRHMKVVKDGGAFANITTLPAVTPASSKSVKVTLSSTEMNADEVIG